MKANTSTLTAREIMEITPCATGFTLAGAPAAISATAMIPYAGDLAKAGKYGTRAAKAINAKAGVSIIQTGGHTLKPSTLKALGMSKGEGKKAIEALKRENGLPNDWHGKIGSDGSVF